MLYKAMVQYRAEIMQIVAKFRILVVRPANPGNIHFKSQF